MKFIIVIFLIITITSCSNKDMYSNLQNSHTFSCEKLKSNQYEDCMNQYSDSYEDYTAKRQATLNK